MRSRVWFCALVLLTLGCRSDKLVHPLVPDPVNIYWRLDINHPAVMLSVHQPYDTVQLVATPMNVYGDPIPTEQRPTFRNVVSIDTAVQVDSNGFVTAHYPTGAASRIEVALKVGNYVKIDTVLIMVRNDASVRFIDSVRLRPDSTWRWKGYFSGVWVPNWVKVYVGTSEIVASERVIDFSVDDPELVDCITGSDDSCNLLGETYIRVSMYAYGRTLSDSVLFRRIEPPVNVVVFRILTRPDGSREPVFFPKELRINKGNTVFFVNRAVRPDAGAPPPLGLTYGNDMKTYQVGAETWGYADSVDIVFDDPSKVSAGASYQNLTHTIELRDICGGAVVFNCMFGGGGLLSDGISGNIPAFGHVWKVGETVFEEADKGLRSRQFNEVGEIRYTSARFPAASGKIIVKE